MDAATLKPDGAANVEVDVTNTGKLARDSVVQLYASFPQSQVARPRQALVGFQRVSLRPGETRTVRIPLQAKRLAYWNTERKSMEVEAGPVKLLLGEASDAIRLSTTLELRP